MKKGLFLFMLIFSSALSASTPEAKHNGWSEKAIARCVLAGIGSLAASSACLKRVNQVAFAGGYLSHMSNDPSYFKQLSSVGIIALFFTAVALDYMGKGLLGVAGYKTYEKLTKKEKTVGNMPPQSVPKSDQLESYDDNQP